MIILSIISWIWELLNVCWVAFWENYSFEELTVSLTVVLICHLGFLQVLFFFLLYYWTIK